MAKIDISNDIDTLTEYFVKRLPGQEKLVRSLLTSLKLRDICQNGSFFKDSMVPSPKNHVLIRGCSGTGKTFSVTRICRELDIPFLPVNITDFTSSGYVGASLTDIPKMLIDISKEVLEEQSRRAMVLSTAQAKEEEEEKETPEPSASTPDEKKRAKIKTVTKANKYFDEIIISLVELGINLVGKTEKVRYLSGTVRLKKGSLQSLRTALDRVTTEKKTHKFPKQCQGLVDIDKFLENKKEAIEKMDLLLKPIRSFGTLDLGPIIEEYLGVKPSKGKKGKGPDTTESDAKALAQTRGVILLDEFDKIFMGNDRYNVGTTGIVREILAYLSGSKVPIKGSSPFANDEVFDTNGVVFICAGAFDMVDHRTMPTEVLGRLPTRVKLEKPTYEVFYKMLVTDEVGIWDMLKGILMERKVKGKLVIPDDVSQYFANVLVEDEKHKPIGIRRLTAIVSLITVDAFLKKDLNLEEDYIVTKEIVDRFSEEIRNSLSDF